MSAREDSDSDAPEEFTAEQAIQKDEEITTIQKQNKARIAREVKERRRKWAEKLTPRQPRPNKNVPDEEEETETPSNKGMLPDDIVKLLAANEKKVFSSESEDEKSEKKPRKKKSKRSGMEPVILKELPPPPCLQNSLEFLKKRKMQVPRSSAVLDNSSQALRFLSSSGLLK
ncbi:hypothetical protein HanRHA438_Chr15g0725191 [Helianthus annuus]|uniref:Uncharacterized protein n=1 Tax=Helianthus annuus TaxID=4232 RepID=A0A251SAZ3_HELAN|nr:uncharacterized protein LOC110912438 [Helianthus annuus]KAF5766227.1 hypothetical protein HanXRQr2_Chr15g0712861 [Helianthus annuus]KAJ0452657.1 hypothetical protein HanHA300_Chr15g0581411 [Helianthus annuus]KAJ0474566.1 hypothetical protein HanHA89_Chr15g0631151 [Helianthus annuus]KAJ0650123.1 hypothetical protein HanLR1_Chr15g0592071 [Helianthus annuus]KAJ0653894.1 hypothetical protein HanOQP8_Chr15g0588721 [Helianthus annuus]